MYKVRTASMNEERAGGYQRVWSLELYCHSAYPNDTPCTWRLRVHVLLVLWRIQNTASRLSPECGLDNKMTWFISLSGPVFKGPILCPND
jgi:hypothetical protein